MEGSDPRSIASGLQLLREVWAWVCVALLASACYFVWRYLEDADEGRPSRLNRPSARSVFDHVWVGMPAESVRRRVGEPSRKSAKSKRNGRWIYPSGDECKTTVEFLDGKVSSVSVVCRTDDGTEEMSKADAP